jgi:hypothetical protein
MVAQLLPEFLKLHAACAGLSEFFEATASLAGYFPKPTLSTRSGHSAGTKWRCFATSSLSQNRLYRKSLARTRTAAEPR